MFRKISLQQQRIADAENPLDLAFLAEAMLFYGNVEILVNRGSLKQLIREIGPELLLEFLNRGYLSLRFEPNHSGIYTSNAGTAFESHSLVVFEVQGQQALDVIRPLTISAVSKEGKGRRLARKLVDQIADAPIDEKLTTLFAADLTNPNLILNGAKTVLEASVPEVLLPMDLRFKAVSLSENNFRIDTNLDFASLNNAYHRRVPVAHSSLSPALVLSHLLIARKMLEDGARAECEIAVAPLYAALISLRVSDAFMTRAKNENQIQMFQDFIFDDGRSLAGACSAKERTFRDLLPLLDKASKFRIWLQEREPDSTLIKEYFRAVTEQSWMDRLPTKMTRWSLFTGIGLTLDASGAGGLGTMAGVLASAADAFFLNKVLKGWRPNQFVEGPFKTFVR